MVCKPDSQTLYSALAVELLYRAGLPRRGTRSCRPAVVGTAIAERCDYLMFTGSTATGRHCRSRPTADRLAELGGKNPMIVTRGAAGQGRRGATRACFSNAKQLHLDRTTTAEVRPPPTSSRAQATGQLGDEARHRRYDFFPPTWAA